MRVRVVRFFTLALFQLLLTSSHGMSAELVVDVLQVELYQLEDIFEKPMEEFKKLDIKFYAEKPCACGRKFTFVDFVNSAMHFGIHSKEFLLHHMFRQVQHHPKGKKPLKCPECQNKSYIRSAYSYNNWSCSDY